VIATAVVIVCIAVAFLLLYKKAHFQKGKS
jgi:hypothetical protein